jgi:hypothetical protein
MTMACANHPPASPAWQIGRAAPSLRIHRLGDAGRADVEEFVRGVFASRFGARIDAFAPVLVSLRDEDGIVAAAGYRSAAAGPLFLERYLPQPVQAMLAPTAGAEPQRGRIAEVGHLAATQAGEGRRLIRLLGKHLASEGFVWVVSTLTVELRLLFRRIGVVPITLGTADPGVLGPQAHVWGSYYEHAPAVLAGHLPQALQRLERRAAAAGELA